MGTITRPKERPPKLVIRRFTRSDVDALTTLMTDDKVSLYTGWDTCKNRSEVADYLETTILPHPWFRAVCVDGAMVAFVYVDRRGGCDRYKAELNGCLARANWGSGVAAPGLRMVVTAVFDDWPDLERLEALAAVENVRSQRLLEACGFQREGLLRRSYFTAGRFWDAFMYAYLRQPSPSSRM